jgi:hypothetical protein
MKDYCEQPCRKSTRKLLAQYAVACFSIGFSFASLTFIAVYQDGTLGSMASNSCQNTSSQQ